MIGAATIRRLVLSRGRVGLCSAPGVAAAQDVPTVFIHGLGKQRGRLARHRHAT